MFSWARQEVPHYKLDRFGYTKNGLFFLEFSGEESSSNTPGNSIEVRRSIMARGEKSGNPEMKRHRAARIADRMMQDGATRMDANRIATAAMDREYAGDRGNLRGASVDVDRHDSGSGQRKTNLTTKRGASVSGASKPNAAKTIGTQKAGLRRRGAAEKR